MRLPSLTTLLPLAGFVLGGCVATTPATNVAVSDNESAYEESDAQAELREHHRHHHLGGVTKFVALSLDTLGANDAQRPQILQLQRDLFVCMAPVGRLENDMLIALADGVSAGNVDTAKVDLAMLRLTESTGAVRTCSVSALNQLHALLTPIERSVVADKVQAHWEVWSEVNQPNDEGSLEAGSHLTDLSDELDLGKSQTEDLSRALRKTFSGVTTKFDSKPAETEVQALTNAFSESSFDAKTLPVSANALFVSRGLNRIALFYSTVTPLLTPEQRTMLSEDLREHAAHQRTTLSAK